jgi:molybdopterin biosynthesis enzyme MoaB
LKLLSGLDAAQCMHAEVDAAMAGDVALDPERPEYHRAAVEWVAGGFTATSTGSQLSSRLLSLVGANGLVCVPKGPGKLLRGTRLPVLLLGPLPAPRPGEGFHGGHRPTPPQAAVGQAVSSPPPPAIPSVSTRCQLCVLTVAMSGMGGGASAGSAAVSQVLAQGRAHGLDVALQEARILDRPSAEEVRAVVEGWAKGLRPNLVLVVGGCGLGPLDTVPEALAPLLSKHAPGLAHFLRDGFPEVFATDRGVAGMARDSFVVTLPAAATASAGLIDALLPLLARLIQTSAQRKSSAYL